jgi:hypothetical protein
MRISAGGEYDFESTWLVAQVPGIWRRRWVFLF